MYKVDALTLQRCWSRLRQQLDEGDVFAADSVVWLNVWLMEADYLLHMTWDSNSRT